MGLRLIKNDFKIEKRFKYQQQIHLKLLLFLINILQQDFIFYLMLQINNRNILVIGCLSAYKFKNDFEGHRHYLCKLECSSRFTNELICIKKVKNL